MEKLTKLKTVMLGVGELGIASEPGSRLKTAALGSCVAVIIMDPKTRTVGMVQIALPESRVDPDRAKKLPGYFADTGILSLMHEMVRQGCQKNEKGWIVKLVGGAHVADLINAFNMGKQNTLAVKKALCKYGLVAKAEDLGKRINRTVAVDVDQGRVVISSPGRGDWEI